MSSPGISPAASGPAGAHFEAQVGACYLLSLLLDAEPRGLPGVTIEKVAFQRAGEGRALDDVIVHARDASGGPATLEIQVKRTLTFTPGDTEFRSVVSQIVRASRRADFWSQRYELAIAISRTSQKIDGPYQDVLSWARAIGDGATFFAQIKRPGAANEDMRTFVRTFRRNLEEAGAHIDDDTVWKLLRRLQILVFDYTAPGSAWELWDLERGRRALASNFNASANALRTSLVELVMLVASSAGDRDRASLVEDLRQRDFVLSPSQNHRAALARLEENSRAALSDIHDRIGTIKLARPSYLAAVRSALDEWRYVEIRGDAGVGKSGVLKHLAEQLSDQGRVLVLSPQRTVAGGWQAMQHLLDFNGTSRELMVELAGSGGGVLFIDSVDFFDEDKRLTIVDLVGAAAAVPGITVLVSARRSFATDELNWLPENVIAQLGSGAPILVNELSDDELAELREAAPTLAPLLAANHPANKVTRNLFRLSRLVMRPALQVVRSEEEMADVWWSTADGVADSHGAQRERGRVLRLVAEQAIRRADPASVEDAPAAAVDALVRSDTFRDLGEDRITFSHDVLREWAMACWLRLHREALVTLPTDRPAPPDLARAIELLARFDLTSDPTGAAWNQLLESFSVSGTHGSWRRAVLLAVVRSENADTLLRHASDPLRNLDGAVLIELLRTLQAVEVTPGAEVYADVMSRLDGPPVSFSVPRSVSWIHLILWLLARDEEIPKQAIPDIVSLYSTWALGMLGKDPLTPRLMPSVYRWLLAVEEGRHNPRLETNSPWPFDGSVGRNDLESLEHNLRSMFLSFASSAPSLAAAYVTHLLTADRDRVVEGLMKFSGTLAEAAPAELAVLTMSYLTRAENRQGSRPSRDPFDFQDLTFMPASPLRGPFFGLLTHAPGIGLGLIRSLVDHAIAFKSGGDSPTDHIEIAFPGRVQSFVWPRSYYWAREWSSAPYAVKSALMALELWLHRRLEAGDSLDKLYAEFVGTQQAHACYLLPVVDMILSHWPATRDFAVPFLASPDVLSLDRERTIHERADLFNEAMRTATESAGLSQLQQLRSRRQTLDEILGRYATVGVDLARDELTSQLQRAQQRLGPYGPEATLADLQLLVVYALNLVNPENWRDVVVERGERGPVVARQYVSPPEEEAHLAALRAQGAGRSADADMQSAIMIALEDPARSSTEFAESVARWASAAPVAPVDSDDTWMRDQATIVSAMLLARDGTAAAWAQYGAWARRAYSKALDADENAVHRNRTGLRFNPKAIALAGMLNSLKFRAEPEDIDAILGACASQDPAAAYGLGAAINAVVVVEPRLLAAATRCAFQARLEPTRSWDTPAEEDLARREQYQARLQLVVEGELRWLIQNAPEPGWPIFPARQVQARRRLRIGRTSASADTPAAPRVPQEVRVDQQGAALWLTESLKAKDVGNDWLVALVRCYSLWTAQANGLSDSTALEIENPPTEWNAAYFSAVVRVLPALQGEEIQTLAITPVVGLSDDSFFVAAETLVRSVDLAYFGDKTIEAEQAVRIRSAIATRLLSTQAWQRLAGDCSGSVETRSASTIATLFFSDHGFIGPSRTYLLPIGIDRVDSFLPSLLTLVQSAPSLFVAHLTLSLLEVAPHSRHVGFLLQAASSWLGQFPSSTLFWADSNIGRRICAWLEGVWNLEGIASACEEPARSLLDHLLSKLVTLGISEASVLEQKLLCA